MELDYLKIANSPIMWISVIPAVLLLLYQSFTFAKRAVLDGKKMGITDYQFKAAIKSSFFSSFGPSLLNIIAMVGLLSSMGGPVTWLRLSFIGSIMYELPAADRAATAAGSTLGTADMTMGAYANAVWIMSVCCLGWIIIATVFADKMENFREKIAGDNKAILGIIASAAGMGAFGYQTWRRALPGFTAQTWTAIAGFTIMILLNVIYNKTKKSWVKQFGLTISMIGGMIIGSLFL